MKKGREVNSLSLFLRASSNCPQTLFQCPIISRIPLSSQIEINSTVASEWDNFVSGSPRGHLLQTSQWGKLKSAFGWQCDRVTVRQGETITAGAQVLFRMLPIIGKFRPMSIGYIPKGPVFDYKDDALLKALLGGLDRLCRQRGAVCLKIEPDEPHSIILRRKLLASGFRDSRRAVQPQSTIILDLTAGMEESLARMSAKTRYNIRLSERKGIRVMVGSESDIEEFYRLALVTSQRDKFPVHNLEYYQKAYLLFREIDAVQLFLAFFQEKLLAGLMAFALGAKAWYLYGASSDEERQRMPNHALQWAAMNWAWHKGCDSYDLWGIPAEAPLLEETQSPLLKELIESPPHGSLWGVYRFKRGFGGEPVRYVGAYDRVYSPVLYWIYDKFIKRGHQLA